METRKLGSNFEISAIGLGCMGMTHGFGDASDQKEMIEVIRGAYQAGITMFDTAECYQGVSETGEILYNGKNILNHKIRKETNFNREVENCGRIWTGYIRVDE